MHLARKYKAKPTIPLSSMADLAMLLLIFFVICGRMSTQATVPIIPPISVTGRELEGEPIAVAVDAQGLYYLDGTLIDPEGLRLELEAALEGRSGIEARTVLIEVDEQASYRDWAVVVDAVDAARGYVEVRVKQ